MNNKKKIYIVLAAMALAMAVISAYYGYNSAYYVKTDDATVDGDVLKISPQIAAKILEVRAQEGDRVVEGQVMARLDDVNLSNPELALVKSPGDGLIIKKLAHAGEMAAPAQAMYMLVDPEKLYITANIEENKRARLKEGQKVDITLDSLPGAKFTGQIETLGEASLSTFSLLPTGNTSGNFTKVVQRVPVKIILDDTRGYRLMKGTNAFVRIHIR